MSAIANAQEAPTLFHVTHWKAGSQWIYKILRELAPERIVPPQVGERQLFVEPLTHGAIYPSCFATREQLALRLAPEARQAFAVLRDLRDTLVSAYFSMRYSHALESGWMSGLRAELELLSEEQGLILLMERWLPACAAIHASWLGSGEIVVTYEALLERDGELLEELLVDRLGAKLERKVIRECVAANRFAALAGGRERGQEDVHHHQRKGVVGDWSNHFTLRVAHRFDELYGALAGTYPIQARTSRSSTQHVSLPGAGAALPVLQRWLPRLKKPSHVSPPATAMAAVDRHALTQAYDLVSSLYPHVPSYTLWMAWELAAMRRHPIAGEVLDLGCQDPRLAVQLLHGAVRISGLAFHPSLAEAALQQGGYAKVADTERFDQGDWHGRFDAVYARGSLSVCDDLARNLQRARSALRPGGVLVCSVLSDRFARLSGFAACLGASGETAHAARIFRDYLEFHHVRHALCQADWEARLALAGFRVAAITPIVPATTFQVFSLIDELWHTSGQTGQTLGVPLAARLAALPGFRSGFRSIVDGLAEIDGTQADHAALVIKATAD